MFHRQPVVYPRRVRLSLVLEERTEVGVIDGQSEVASEFLLSGERRTEYGVCRDVVVERQTDVAYAVERLHLVLLRHLVVLVAVGIAYLQCEVVVVGSLVEDSQPAEVSAYVVEGLHHIDCVAQFLAYLHLLLVAVDGFKITVALAVYLAETLQRHHFAHEVLLLVVFLHLELHCRRVVDMAHDAVCHGFLLLQSADGCIFLA